MRECTGKHAGQKRKSKSPVRKAIVYMLIFAVSILQLCHMKSIFSFFTYMDILSNAFTMDNDYTIIYDANGGSGTMANQKMYYNTPEHLTPNAYTNGTLNFLKWNTRADGQGVDYADEEEVVGLVAQNHGTITLYAQWTNAVAEINGTQYPSLQLAIDDVTGSDLTTIKLLTNTNECLTVSSGQKIVLNLQNYTVTSSGNGAVIENHGELYISNGTIRSISAHAAINNRQNAKLYISGGNITGHERQAIYNDNGLVEISGNPTITTDSTVRAALQNLASGTMTITGGTIISTGHQGVNNAGTMTIGVEDGSASKTSPEIRGLTYGVSSTTNFNWYDGIVKGNTGAFNNESKIQNKETGHDIIRNNEDIDGVTYHTAYQAISCTVIFNANGGQVSESTRNCEHNTAVGPLPIPKRTGFEFDGWFTSATGGTQITENTIITQDDEFFAHWTELVTAEINGTFYNSVQAAVDAVPTNSSTDTTIKLLRDTSEAVTVPKNKNILFDLQNYTLSNDDDNQVINNNGKIKIINGTITSSAAHAAIDNNSTGTLIMTGGSIITTGERQAIYNSKGKVEISGTAYLSSTTGIRGTIVNLQGGTVVINGGTIISHNQQAVDNAGTLTIGTKDGNINASTPVLQGKTNGVTNTNVFNFYDGILKGVSGAVSGNIDDTETNSTQTYGSESIDGDTYETMYLTAN